MAIAVARGGIRLFFYVFTRISYRPPRGFATGQQGRRFEEPRYSLSFESKALTPGTNLAQFCRVRAAASGPGIEDAPLHARRFYEPQKRHLFLTASACRPLPRAAKPLGEQAGDSTNRATRSRTKFQPKARPHARPSAARKPFPVFVPEEQSQPKAQPNSPSRVRLTAAPLALRRFLPSPAAILAGLAKCQPAEYVL